jgi:hypothetical protein
MPAPDTKERARDEDAHDSDRYPGGGEAVRGRPVVIEDERKRHGREPKVVKNHAGLCRKVAERRPPLDRSN